jgi:hypothetical protein
MGKTLWFGGWVIGRYDIKLWFDEDNDIEVQGVDGIYMVCLSVTYIHNMDTSIRCRRRSLVFGRR